MGAMQEFMMGQQQQQFMMMQQQQLMMAQQQSYANAMAMMSANSLYSNDLDETQCLMGQQAYANAVAAMNQRNNQEDEESDVPPGPSSNVHHPNYRPPDMEPIIGITDRRFEGHIKLWFDDKGYGFIECKEVKKRFPDVDVFLHLNQK